MTKEQVELLNRNFTRLYEVSCCYKQLERSIEIINPLMKFRVAINRWKHSIKILGSYMTFRAAMNGCKCSIKILGPLFFNPN